LRPADLGGWPASFPTVIEAKMRSMNWRTVGLIAGVLGAMALAAGAAVAAGGRPILRHGKVLLTSTWSLDLDTGELPATDVRRHGPDHQIGADVTYDAEDRNDAYLTPAQGAQLSIPYTSPPGYDQCSAARYSTIVKWPVNAAMIGNYYCAKTDEGRIAQFHVGLFPGQTYPGITDPGSSFPRTLVITFTTWRK
jgi:hypothetical protein